MTPPPRAVTPSPFSFPSFKKPSNYSETSSPSFSINPPASPLPSLSQKMLPPTSPLIESTELTSSQNANMNSVYSALLNSPTSTSSNTSNSVNIAPVIPRVPITENELHSYEESTDKAQSFLLEQSQHTQQRVSNDHTDTSNHKNIDWGTEFSLERSIRKPQGNDFKALLTEQQIVVYEFSQSATCLRGIKEECGRVNWN